MAYVFGSMRSGGGAAIYASMGEGAGATVPDAPTDVEGAATGGTTATLTLTDNTGDTASHRWQLRVVAGVWEDAAGATNPSAPGITSFAATGLDPATEYEVQARAEDVGGNSAYVAGANFWTDNTGGGGSELPVHVAPTVTTHPSSATVIDGLTASFTAAFAGYPAPTFQWLRGGVAISGATSGTYSFTAALADTGAQFTCTGTNVLGSVTTSAATLTVNPVGRMEATLVQLLEAICPRVFPEVAPLNTQRPYITYQQIGGRTLRWLDGTASDKRHALMQINVWHSLRIAAADMAQDIEESLCAQSIFIATPQGEIQTTFEHDLGLYGTIQTFGILYRR